MSPASHQPRDRYKKHYFPSPDGIEVIPMDSPTSHDRMLEALCKAWDAPYPPSARDAIGDNLRNKTLLHDSETADQFVWALDHDPATAEHAVNLITSNCGSMRLRVFIKLAAQQDNEGKSLLYLIFNSIIEARRTGSAFTAKELLLISSLLSHYVELTGMTWSEVIETIPGITVSEELCLRFVDIHPELASVISERLAAGSIPERLAAGIDEELLETLAQNPAPALTEGTL